jgi:hypothetical protein
LQDAAQRPLTAALAANVVDRRTALGQTVTMPAR